MLKSYKYRIYPNKKQSELLDKHFSACRFIYNLALETKNYAYVSARKNLSCFALNNQLPELKKECSWLKEIDSQALQQSIINLDKAFTAFFKQNSKFPKFKKKNDSQSFRSPQPSTIKVDFNKNNISIPKFKQPIKVVYDRQFDGKIKSATFKKEVTGKYYVSILIDNDIDIPTKKQIKEKTTVGIDLGLKSFIVTSDGVKIDNPKFLKNSIQRIKVLQKRLRHKKNGSNNKKKAHKKIALLHEKIKFQRQDFLHKLSTNLVNNHDTISFETLQIKNMVKNHCLAQAINDVGWGIFVDMCKYKGEWYGKNILQIGMFEPSTKMCSNCGNINNLLSLSDREWLCGKCGSSHDRDINAAINIKNYSLKNSGWVTPGELVESLTLVRMLKQEVHI